MPIDWKQTTVKITIAGVSAGIGSHRQRWHESIPDFDLWYVFRGEGVIHAKDNKTIKLMPGTCLWLSPGHVYEVTHDPANPLTNYYVHFELLNLSGQTLPYELPIPSERVEVGDGVMVDSVMRRIVDLIPFYGEATTAHLHFEHYDTASALFRGLLMDLTQSSQPDNSKGDSGIRRRHRELMMRCAAQMQNSPIHTVNLRRMAKGCGYSLEHFSRTFRRVMGQPAEEFLIGVRIDRAKQLLNNSSDSIEKISRMLGYRYPNFFSAQFRQRTGKSPSQYRKRQS